MNFIDPTGGHWLVIVAAVLVVPVRVVQDVFSRWKAMEKGSNARAQQVGATGGLHWIDAENAMRHCAGQCDLARARGSEVATAADWYHENPSIPSAAKGGGSENAPGGKNYPDRLRDEHNNICGRANAKKSGDCIDLCAEDLASGRLATATPFGTDMSEDPLMSVPFFGGEPAAL